MLSSPRLAVLLSLLLALACPVARAQRQMEPLGRGLVSLRTSSTQTYVGWRLLGNDPEGVAFNLYRSANGGAPVKLNASPLIATTDYVDTPANLATTAYTYSVRPVLNGIEVPDTWANPAATGAAPSLPADASTRQYVPVPLQPVPDGAAADYDVKFAWVGDLDGDGEYDFVVDRTNKVATSRQWLQAYRRDGALLWQVCMGPNSLAQDNIYSGSAALSTGQSDNVTVFDLDGDGRSEVIVRTANGVIFNYGSATEATLSAPDDEIQYISILDGVTGAEKARSVVPIPAGWATRTHILGGNMGVVYADGLRPSVFFHGKNRNADGSFNNMAATWDYRGGALTLRWQWDAVADPQHTAEGHQLRFADVDNDGRDEYVDIGLVLKADGSGQLNGDKITEVVHGDRYHVTDIDPERPGLETYLIQQNNGSGLATAYHAADKSAVIKKLYASGVIDVGRGTVGGFVPALNGLQMFSTFGGTYDAKGNQLYASAPFPPETIWWDADLGREFLSTIGGDATSPGIDKFNTANGSTGRVLSLYSDANAPGSPYNNYIAYGGRPQFWGDILGDWREELVCVATDNSELRIYTTRTPDAAKSHDGVAFRIPTLMHDPQYRIQATAKGYVQSSYPGYYLGYNMSPPPPSPMVPADLVWTGGAGLSTWNTGSTASWKNTGTSAASAFVAGQSVRLDLSGSNASPVALSGSLQPGDVTVYSPIDYTFDGSAGSLAGPMKLLKAGKGALRITGVHAFTGATTVWDGALRIDGALAASPVTVWGGTWGGALAKGLTGGRLAGSGSVAQPVTLRYRGALTPGAGMGSAGTLSLGAGLSARDGAVLAFDLSADPASPTANDRLAITGNLALSGKVSVVVNQLSGSLSPGTYTLATYTGSLTGSVSNLSVLVPDGTPYTVSLASGALTLNIPVTRAAAAVTWTGSLSSAWDLANTQNWRIGATPAPFVAGDTVAFDDSGSARPTVTLDVAAPVGGLSFSGATNYTISGSGSIAGAGGLAKSGSGTVTLNTANTFTGPVSITGGVLAVPAFSDAGEPGPLGASSPAAANLVLDGGVLRLSGPQTSMNRSATLGAAGGGFDIPSGTSLQISGSLTGVGALTKSGPGTLLLAAANTYSGGTIINGGKIYLAGSTANKNGLGSGTVTINGGTLSMADVQNNDVAAWNLVVPAGAAARLDADGRCSLTGSLTGSGDLTYFSPYVRSDLKGNWSAFTGRLFHVGGDLRFANTHGLGNSTVDLAAGTYAYSTVSSNHTFSLGALSGSGALSGNSNAGRTVTWQIGAKNLDTVFSGVVGNGSGTSALTKVGAGALTLSGANTYTGATTVSASKLVLSGGSLASTVTVSSGAAFGGNGSVVGNVAFAANSTLLANPGAGPLAITGNLSLGGAISVAPAPGATLAAGVYPLYTYTGTLTGTPSFAWSGAGYAATFDTSVTGRVSITLAVPPRDPADLVWTGAAGASWDASTVNWTWSGGATFFQTDDRVRFDDTSSVAAITLPADVAPAAVTVDSSKNYTFSGTGILAGSGTLTKSGSGSLALSSANTFTGGSTLNGGSVVLGNATGLGTGPITLSGGSLTVNTAFSNPIVVSAAGGAFTVASNRTVSGALTGSGVLTVNAAASTTFANVVNFTGTVSMANSSGAFRANSSGFVGGSGWTLDLGANTASFTRSNSAATVNIGALAGGSGTAFNNGATATTYVVGAKNTDSTFAGAITGAASITKTGSGVWTLSGANTYTGATTVSSGALLVTGYLATTAVSVSADATFGGTGTLGGSLTLASGARLALGVGASATQGLAVSGTTTLTGNITVVPALLGGALAPGTHTLLAYSGVLGGSPTFTWLDTTGSGYVATFDTASAGLVKITVAAPAALSPIESWRIIHFGASSATGEAANDADPDSDGIANLLEYALGGDPWLGDASAILPAVSVSAGQLSLAFTRIADPALTYTVQATSDLAATWDGVWSSTGADNTAGPVTVPDPEPLGAHPRRFLRLRVTR